MSQDRDVTEARRRFLKLVGGSAALVPFAGLAGCSGDKDAPTSAAAVSEEAATAPVDMEPEAAAEAPVEEMAAAEAPAQDGGMPEVSENDPTAKSLGYRHDVADIDSSQYPRYQAGQICGNCALYQGGDGDEWAGCSIFPGKLVKATGWCSVYAPKVG